MRRQPLPARYLFLCQSETLLVEPPLLLSCHAETRVGGVGAFLGRALGLGLGLVHRTELGQPAEHRVPKLIERLVAASIPLEEWIDHVQTDVHQIVLPQSGAEIVVGVLHLVGVCQAIYQGLQLIRLDVGNQREMTDAVAKHQEGQIVSAVRVGVDLFASEQERAFGHLERKGALCVQM